MTRWFTTACYFYGTHSDGSEVSNQVKQLLVGDGFTAIERFVGGVPFRSVCAEVASMVADIRRHEVNVNWEWMAPLAEQRQPVLVMKDFR
jgi:uncharacterized protein (DUF2126 family)